MNVFPEQTSLITLSARPRSSDSAVIAILLEALHLPYTIHLTHSHHPHLPYLTDIQPSGSQIALHDLVSIVSYLVAQYDGEKRLVSYRKGSKEAADIQGWVGFLTAQGQAQAQTQSPGLSSQDRQIRKTRADVVRKTLHLYLHLEVRLQDRKSGGFLVGKRCTLADLIHFPAVAAAGSIGLDLERFPELTAWHNRLCGMGAVQRGMTAVKLDLGS